MGSLISTPKAAPAPVIVQAPAPAPVTVTTSETATDSTDISAAENAQEAREQNLLKRDRSRFGTIATSFRGFLDLADRNSKSRKTLLGE
tara:strand:+ start:134 stop:400 length:267 start_codon:yes stop_codon:yes gene_type:complete